MNKIILSLVLLSFAIKADSIILLKKGWQCIGSSTAIKDMSKFKEKDVEQVWHFDSATQKWLGFSPNKSIQNRMRDKNISKLTKLERWHGFWVKSKRDWALLLPDNNIEKAPKDENNPRDIIQLKKGWNLISLPIDSVVSPDIFDGMTLWKYDSKKEWELFDSENRDREFPPIKYINNSDAIWVKADLDKNISISEKSSKLHNFASKKEMVEYIKDMAISDNRQYGGISHFYLEPFYEDEILYNTDEALPTPAVNTVASAENSRAGDTSNTNNQEIGVDEGDILKHNGKYIFHVVSGENPHINITSFNKLVATNEDTILSQIDIDNNLSVKSIYLVDNKLIVLSLFKDTYIYRSDNYSNPKSIIDIYDISTIDNINKITTYKIDGNILTSRVIKKELYLISNFTPQVNITYPKKYIELSPLCKEFFYNLNNNQEDYEDEKRYAECFNILKDYDSGDYFRYDYDNPIVEVKQIIPQISKDDKNTKDLISASRLYAPSKQNQSPIITTISHISLANNEYKGSNSFIGYSSTEYASKNAFYLVSDQYPIYYDFYNYKERSKIYKFALDNKLDYRGVGEVYGHVLNQFSLSEYKNILRVATTVELPWGDNTTENSLYTLKDENGVLKIVGLLSGLGKKGENIKSVRFLDDKAFVVTFRQTDPFYTIDMSNPKAPKKMGELQVHGYSAYLHPIGEDMILGIGKDATEEGMLKGLKIELFDISDLSNPQSLDTIILPDGTYSELEYNHKAFAYRSSDNLFSFPYTQSGDYMNEYKIYSYLGVYQVVDNSLKKYLPIKDKSINYYGKRWNNHRGLIFDMNSTTYITMFNNSDSILTENLENLK